MHTYRHAKPDPHPVLTSRDVAEPNEPIYSKADDNLDRVWWLGSYLLHNARSHDEIVVMVDVDKAIQMKRAGGHDATDGHSSAGNDMEEGKEEMDEVQELQESEAEEVVDDWHTHVSLNIAEEDTTDAQELSVGDGFFVALRNVDRPADGLDNNDGRMVCVDVWCAPLPSASFTLTRLTPPSNSSLQAIPPPLIDLATEGLVGNATVSACGDRFVVLDADGAVGLWSVNLSARSVTKVAQLPPIPGHRLKRRELALGNGPGGQSAVISVWCVQPSDGLALTALL